MNVAHKQPDTDLFGVPLDGLPPKVSAAIELLSLQGNTEDRGAIFTRPEVVDFILDLAGYTSDKPLYLKRVLEPSFGGGEFLIACMDRLIEAWARQKGTAPGIADLADCICAVELHKETYSRTRLLVVRHLCEVGFDERSANALATAWLIQDDFLLAPLEAHFDFIIGNPPYVRQERIPTPLLTEYRKRYHTLYDRADLYVPFIERSLQLLAPTGVLGFICADRWMKNRYGGPLRQLIARHFHLDIFVDMVDTPAFMHEVATYPAITIISKKKSPCTRIAFKPIIDRSHLKKLAAELTSGRPLRACSAVRNQTDVAHEDRPWLFDTSDKTRLLRRLEQSFPCIEETGCKIGIGVATGADQAFIGPFDSLDVEDDRKLPLATTRDIETGEVVWRGQGVINPFAADGRLVDLKQYPRLSGYLKDRKEILARRHCAQANPSNWYRTIDRIHPEWTLRPKLLIPDIKGAAHIVYEGGNLYPHHNLYYVVSDAWDLRALQAVLMSTIISLAISSYSTQMRGGYLRFQAQYLRRIHLPHWQEVPETVRGGLIRAAVERDVAACNRFSYQLFDLTEAEQTLLSNEG